MFISNPTTVIRLGANQRGTRPTNHVHQGCKNMSHILLLLHEYLCSLSLFNWTFDNNFCL